MNAGEKVFVSWSGGKDAYLALLKAREAGLQPGCLLTFINKDSCSMSHNLPVELLSGQARALNLPQILEPVTWDSYEETFHRVSCELKQKGFTGGVFGDINITEHRHWLEKACARVAVNCYLPLWGLQEEDILSELLALKAELLIVALRKDLLEDKWLGRLLNVDFIQEVKCRGLSPCGESGEYHTLVVNGPLFKEKLEVEVSGYRSEEKVIFLDYFVKK